MNIFGRGDVIFAYSTQAESSLVVAGNQGGGE